MSNEVELTNEQKELLDVALDACNITVLGSNEKQFIIAYIMYATTLMLNDSLALSEVFKRYNTYYKLMETSASAVRITTLLRAGGLYHASITCDICFGEGDDCQKCRDSKVLDTKYIITSNDNGS